jgi:RNA polymerase sigma-70 factor (ECF subfamily)
VPSSRRPRVGQITFDELERHRSQLLVHCFQLLGSRSDAEDAVQETLLRAWRGIDSFEGRSSLSTWLYTIATRLCITEMGRRQRRPGEDGISDAARAVAAASTESSYAALESVGSAWLAALRRLTARQRAVLILRDVLGWPAADVATLLGWSVGSVDVGLHRARAIVAKVRRADREPPRPTADERALLTDYLEAWERQDWQQIATFLRRDVVFRKPPESVVVRGRSRVIAFFATTARRGTRYRITLSETRRGPALAFYRSGPGERRFLAYALQLVTLRAGRVATITTFRDPPLFALLRLPPHRPKRATP